ncbi:MAG: hydroxymethylbilane synthase [Gammaproteobacteria bacterium]
MTKRHLTIATRESPLAMRQAEIVRDQLIALHPHLSVDFLGITTKADKRLDVTLTSIGGKGLFVKELEEALLDGRADIAVHSMKDVPMDLPPGLILPVITEREEPRDVFVSNQYNSIMLLPRGAALGTSSLRRQTQLRLLRSDIELKNLRGNIQTRLKRLDEGDYDGIILAAAGLQRMGLGPRIRSYLSTEESLPSAGQGALGLECREGDAQTIALIMPLNNIITAACVTAERAMCRQLGGGCQVPVAAFAQIHHHELTLRGLVSNRLATKVLRADLTGEMSQAENIGKRVAEQLAQQGAERILKEFY